MHEEQGHDRHEWDDYSQLDSKDGDSQDPAWQHPGTLAWTDDRNERASAETIAKEEPAEANQHEDRQEYEAMDIPEHWLPLPLFLVRNVPAKRDIVEDDVKRMIESARPLKVHSVAFDQQQTEKVLGRRTALVRLEPLQLPWLPAEPEVKDEDKGRKEEDENQNYSSAGEESREGHNKHGKQSKRGSKPPKDGDTNTYANWAVQKLRNQKPPLQVGGELVTFEPSTLQVQLYIGNLSPEWQEDLAFVNAMSEYGSLERAYVMRNSAGLSKGYGFVEFSLPSAAMACKRAMDDIERNMRPDPKKASHKPAPKRTEKKDEVNDDGKSADKDDKTKEEERARAAAFKLAGWPEGGPRLVKLLRAEWASLRTVESMFSKVLYVANLRTHTGSQGQLKQLFSQFGKISEVTVPKNKATQSTKGFAFVLYENGIHADSAYRALEKSGSEEIGGALVSFANSAKQVDYQGRNGMNQGPRPNNAVGRGMPAVRPGPGPPMFPPGRGGGGRGLLPGRGPVLTPGRVMPGRGRGFPEPTDPYHSQLQIQQDLQAQQARMQQELEQRLQSQMQSQLRQAQLQLQQAQQQTQLLQRQALQAQAKAAQEAEARKRAEEEARRAAAMAAANKPPMGQPSRGGVPGFGGIGDGMGARGPQGSYGGYSGGTGSGSGGPAARFNTSQAQGYGQSGGYGQTNASAGFNASSQGYGSQAGGIGGFGQGNYSLTGSQGYGAGDNYGSGGGGGGAGSNYAGSDYEGSAYGGQGGYGGGSADALGYGQGGYEQGGSYEQGYGYGGDGGYEGAGNQAAYGSGQSEYGAPGYGQGSVAGYGESSVYGQSGYGEYGQQAVGSGQQKRTNPYAQPEYGSGSGGYGAVGDRGKRGRY